MTTPYQTLAVSEQATDEEIKKAYLKKVREFPPEQAAEQFQSIRLAYENIKTKKDRIRYAIFGVEKPDVCAELAQMLGKGATQRVNADIFTRALAASVFNDR